MKVSDWLGWDWLWAQRDSLLQGKVSERPSGVHIPTMSCWKLHALVCGWWPHIAATANTSIHCFRPRGSSCHCCCHWPHPVQDAQWPKNPLTWFAHHWYYQHLRKPPECPRVGPPSPANTCSSECWLEAWEQLCSAQYCHSWGPKTGPPGFLVPSKTLP